jgi:membrane-associated phospholipid phosphatase
MSPKAKILLTSFLILLFAGITFIPFISFHEARANALGWRFYDPISELLPAANVSLPIFSITYGSLVLYMIFSYRKENFIARLMLAYGLILLFRMATLTFVPLQAPKSFVYLEDPFLNHLIYPGNIKNDLFFSGHTALVFTIFLLSGRKWIFLILTLLIGVLVMVQRVHYSIDVIAAIPFAWLSAYLTNRFIGWWENRNNE